MAERYGASKLTKRKVGVARQTIGKIVNGERWSWRKAA